MAVRVSRGTGRRAQRRKMVWARSFNQDLTVPISAGVQVNALAQFETEAGYNLIGATVSRIRGIILCQPQVAGPSACRFGARISDVGATTLPNGPFSAPYLDWMMFESFAFNDQLAAVPQSADSPLLGRVVDVRSQRKLEEINEQLTFWVQAGTQAYSVSWDLSILLKLP